MKYNWLKCEDEACQYRFRQTPLSVLNSVLICPGCTKSDLIPEYGESALYEQITFFLHMFNIERYKKLMGNTKSNQIDSVLKSLPSEIVKLLWKNMNELQQHVDRFIRKNGYGIVNCTQLFGQFFRD
ncbi:unnamed protein product [Didymodactylos carnosus]|uniref:Zinc finger DNA-directed DNA polymerase family B alpha domain-containing protein n=1 Tax=Didymodactylos carnosus TaxID=1234261 RepID=A0A816DIW1_9BILA|nr:unnamed protein product [Didymodactylos carnosus]CAF4548207.1 unnamed protein product [Didymodactylos carnosus]